MKRLRNAGRSHRAGRNPDCASLHPGYELIFYKGMEKEKLWA